MDRHGFLAGWKDLSKGKKGVALGVLLVSALGLGLTVKSLSHRTPRIFDKKGSASSDELQQHAKSGGLFQTYRDSIVSIQDKVNSLRRAEIENEKLRFEVSNLRLKVESTQFDCRSKDASSATEKLAVKLMADTGTRLGRTLASINYKPPSHLLAPQLYVLGVQYLKAREDEKAAVILSFLADLDENDTYKTPRNFVLAAVSWYRLDNMELADSFLDRALKAEATQENQAVLAQASLWKALVAERLGKHSKSQQHLRELVDQHPFSTESEWINPQEAEGVTRVPASD
ncbi:hypothetical protein WDW86_15030 [Bdellovibrionota bacterium FG-2]